MSNFSILYPSGQKKLLRVGSESTRVKAGSASYLLRAKSKLGSGQGPSLVCIYDWSFSIGLVIYLELIHQLTEKHRNWLTRSPFFDISPVYPFRVPYPHITVLCQFMTLSHPAWGWRRNPTENKTMFCRYFS